MPAWEARLTIFPPPALIISRPTSWESWKGTLRLMAMVLSQKSSDSDSAASSRTTPALFTRMSIRPNVASASATTDSTLPLTVRSAVTAWVLTPRPASSRAASCTDSERSTRQRSAPLSA